MPAAPHSYRVEAVVLRHSDWGEADRILTLFTLQNGKIRAIAKGARKVKSRKAGHLEPVTRVSLQLAKSRDLDIITQAETIEPYLEIKEDLLRFGTASHVIELVDRFSREEGENRALYQLLVDTLRRIQLEEDLFIATRFFELRLLELAGYRPELFYCVNCGKVVQAEDQFFSLEKGGVLCPSCGRNDPESRVVSLNALRYLRHLQRSNYLEATRAAPAEAVRHEMESLLAADLEHFLGSRLRSREFLQKIKDLK